MSDAAVQLRRGVEVFEAICLPSQSRPNEGSPAHSECEEAERHGLDMWWMTEAFSIILGMTRAAAEHAASAATLLDAGQMTSVPLLARGVLEHAQRACWLLEATHLGTGVAADRVTARQRAARAQLVELSDLRHTKAALEKLRRGADDQVVASERYREIRDQIRTRRAGVMQAFGANTVVTGEPKDWIVEDQCLMSWTSTSEWYFDTLTPGNAGSGVYDTLSSWSHASIVGIRECFEWVMDPSGGGICVPRDLSDLMARIAPTTCSTLYRNLIQVAAYFGWDEALVERWGTELQTWSPGLVY